MKLMQQTRRCPQPEVPLIIKFSFFNLRINELLEEQLAIM